LSVQQKHTPSFVAQTIELQQLILQGKSGCTSLLYVRLAPMPRGQAFAARHIPVSHSKDTSFYPAVASGTGLALLNTEIEERNEETKRWPR
jgi:hypothetical protein